LATVHKFIISQVLLEILNDTNSHLHVVSAVSVDQLTHLLALVGALSDQRGVGAEEVLLEEHVELCNSSLVIVEPSDDLLTM